MYKVGGLEHVDVNISITVGICLDEGLRHPWYAPGALAVIKFSSNNMLKFLKSPLI